MSAPPRLFLLDKFDVAVAGACLKSYTDPSIFKIEPAFQLVMIVTMTVITQKSDIEILRVAFLAKTLSRRPQMESKII
ncbi:hypothetical protein QYF36_004533 [Acer negundo]|nr:hypothetical protein QYF36_004533 [Acer negundo]